MLYSDQDTFEESVSDSSTEVIKMFDSSTEENSFVKSEVDDGKVEEDNEMEDDSDDIDVLIMSEEEKVETHHQRCKLLRQIV